MEGAVVDFINAMSVGDYAAIVKFNSIRRGLDRPAVHADRRRAATARWSMRRCCPTPAPASNVYDGINVALDHFMSPPAGVTLPAGPKAVVVISDGRDNASINTLNFVIDKASSLGIPLFTIAVGTPGTTGSNVMNALAARTGGSFISAPTQTEVTSCLRHDFEPARQRVPAELRLVDHRLQPAYAGGHGDRPGHDRDPVHAV